MRNSHAGDEDASAEKLAVEKDTLKLGFIKLTDCAPLVIAKEKGFFEDEGMQVEVTPQSNWKVLLDNVIVGNLDGAHMLSGQPIAATIGIGTEAHIVTPYTLDLSGNAITVSNSIWEPMQENDPDLDSDTPKHPISAAASLISEGKPSFTGRKLEHAGELPTGTNGK
jgi:nitrate/nitrite transport system substrate-binding protein